MERILAIDPGTGFGKVAFLRSEEGEAEWLLPPEMPEGMSSTVYVSPDGDISMKERSGYCAVRNVKAYLTERTIQCKAGGITFNVNPVTIYSTYVKELVRHANETLKKRNEEPIYKIAITYPATFVVNDDAESESNILKLIKNGVESQSIDGNSLEVVAMLSEPAAASVDALNSKRNDASLNGQYTVIVYDVGHGTFDAALVTSSGDGKPFELIDQCGDTQIGGRIFDKYIYDEMISMLGDYSLSPADKDKLKNLYSTKLKHKLSENELVVEEGFMPEGADGYASITLTRARFEALIENDIRKTLICINKLLERAKREHINVDEIIVTGGSGRIPAIKRMLKEVFSEYNIPVREYKMTDAVVSGAARYAYGCSKVRAVMENSSNETIVEVIEPNPVLTQYAEYSYGIALGDGVRMLIKSGEKLPCKSDDIKVRGGYFSVDVRRAKDKDNRADNIPERDSKDVMRFPFDVEGDRVELKIGVDENRCITVYCRDSRGNITQKTSF